MNDYLRATLAAAGATAVIVVISALAFAITAVSGLPQHFGGSGLWWALGAFLVGLGVLWAGWVFVYRTPKAFFVSTFYTFKKALTRADPSSSLGRNEPFIVDGPYLYVRNPTYFGVCAILFGIALISGLTFLLVAGLGLLAWFNIVVMPYEKREMIALFGQDYVTYTKMVPAFIPSGKVVYGRSNSKPSN